MRILIATTPTATVPAHAFAETVRSAWSDWNPSDQLTFLTFPHEGRGVLESLVDLGFTPRSAGVGVRGGHHVLDAGTLLGDELLTGTTAPLAEAIGSALDAGAARISVAVRPLAVHDGGRGLLESLSSRHGSVRGARAALGAVRLELVASSSLALLGLNGAGASLATVVGPEEAQRIDRGIGEWAAGIERDHLATDLAAGRPLRLSAAPGSGLAGGAGFALQVLGAETTPEAEWLGGFLDVPATLAAHDLAMVVLPAMDGDAMDSSALTVVCEAALENAVPVVVLTREDQSSRRSRAGLGIAASYVVGGNNFEPASVGPHARRVAQTWSRPDSPEGPHAT
nr:hypothetical protein [Actinomycetales bacterium]